MKKNIDRSEFGQRLFDARTSAGVKQEAAARAIGISQGTLAELEKKGQSSGHVAALAQLYSVSPVWLSSGHGDREVAGTSKQRLTMGAAAAAIARASVGLDERTRRKLAQDVSFMIENGPRESETSAIDALATVEVLVPSGKSPQRLDEHPLMGEFLDLDQDVLEAVRHIARLSQTMTVPQRRAMVAALRGAEEATWDMTDEGSRKIIERERTGNLGPRQSRPAAKKAGRS